MWEAIAATAAVGSILAFWIWRVQDTAVKQESRLTQLETWQKIKDEHWTSFEERLFQELREIRNMLQKKQDRQ